MVGHIYIYLYGCVIPLVSECAVYLWVYVCERHSKVILVLSYQGSTFIDPNVIKKNNLLDIAQSPIQLQKQDIKNVNGSE